MCTNFLAPVPDQLERDWGVSLDGDWPTDAHPGDTAPIIRRIGEGAAAQRQAVLARFGLLPASAKAEKPAGSTVNAKTESAASRSAFKGAFLGRQWCIVPAHAFYVPYWPENAKRSERWKVERADRSPLSIAGVWDQWRGEDGRTLTSFSILTINCDLHPLLSRFYRPLNERGEPNEKRTPVLLAEEDFDAWLDTNAGRAPYYFGTFGKDDLRTEPAAPPPGSRRPTMAVPLDSIPSEL
jgi:putative SOS response-associated peptidase YedK